MFQDWRHLTFIHWKYPPEKLRARLPRALRLDTFEGEAWVGMTPFVVEGLRPPGLPAIPWISQFPEMNVRTYVVGPDGQRGIWFFTLEAARLPAVIGARLSYGLPYRWAKMAVRLQGDQVEYRSARYLGGGSARISVRVGDAIRADELTRFLTARFRLYSMWLGRLAAAQVEHAPWPLRSATLLDLSQDVLEHTDLPRPAMDPLVQFSPGVHVRVGRPELVRSR